MREPSSADMTRTALTEKRDREPGILEIVYCFFKGVFWNVRDGLAAFQSRRCPGIDILAD